MDNGKMGIRTCGTRCFVDTVTTQVFPAADAKPATVRKVKGEKVNLKFGKIRVQVANAKRVRVSQDDKTMVILLDESFTS